VPNRSARSNFDRLNPRKSIPEFVQRPDHNKSTDAWDAHRSTEPSHRRRPQATSRPAARKIGAHPMHRWTTTRSPARRFTGQPPTSWRAKARHPRLASPRPWRRARFKEAIGLFYRHSRACFFVIPGLVPGTCDGKKTADLCSYRWPGPPKVMAGEGPPPTSCKPATMEDADTSTTRPKNQPTNTQTRRHQQKKFLIRSLHLCYHHPQ